MRLIDNDALIEAIKNMSQRYCDCKDCDGSGQIIRVSEVIDIAKNEVPTAYDVDKVVMELEERTDFLKNCTKYGNKNAKQQAESYRTIMMYEVADLVDDLIEIVRQGCVSDDVCEWKSIRDGEFIQNPHTMRTFSNEPSMQNVYCNTCGKKIKVVE